MNDKKYIVTCEGKDVEVTEEIYRLFVVEPENEERRDRWAKVGRIEIDLKKENVTFHPCKEDSIDRLTETGLEIEDTSVSVEALDTAVMVKQALEQLSHDERYLIESLFYAGKSEWELAKELGVTQNKIHYHKNRILAKMNKYLRK